MKRIMLIITLSFPLFLFAEIIVVKTKSLHSLDENSDFIQNFLLTKLRFRDIMFKEQKKHIREIAS